jgi:GNAT superfamily N-acetyltransferase
MFLNRPGIEESRLYDYSEYLFTAYSHCHVERVAYCRNKLQVFKVFIKKDKAWIYFMIDTSEKIKKSLGYICLHTIPRWKALETFNLYVPPEYRGMGIAQALYDSVLKDGKIVMSGWSHTTKSHGLWMKIVQNRDYISWAHDILNLRRLAPILIEDDKYVCEFKLYDSMKNVRKKKLEDIRIIVYSPKYFIG